MSRWDKLIITLGVIAVVLFAFVLATEQMTSTFVSATVRPAGDSASEFNSVKEVISRGGLGDNQFSPMTSGDINDYYFVDYTVKLSGICPFPAKWTTMSLSPAPGDVAVIQSDPATVAPFVGGNVTLTLVTTNPDVQRSGWVEYYVLGRQKTAPVNLY